MLDPKEGLEAFWAGEKPKQIPFTIYSNEWRHTKDDPAWKKLYERGMRVTAGSGVVNSRWPAEVSDASKTWIEDGKAYSRYSIFTPMGELSTTSIDGWGQDMLLKTKEDYRIMTWIEEHTTIEAHPEYYQQHIDRMETQHGKVFLFHTCLPRSPIQRILVDYVGLENFGYHLMDMEDEILTLYAAMEKNLAKIVEITAEGPGTYVSMLENFTAETMGPERFERFHMPIYRKYFPILHHAGKIVGTHYDGKLACCSNLIAQAPMDLIESLTPAPEGDMELDDCRAQWPKKLFWSNLNVGCYDLPPNELKALVQKRVQQAAPDGKRLAFEVSEQYPANWKESYHTVLDALEEMAE